MNGTAKYTALRLSNLPQVYENMEEDMVGRIILDTSKITEWSEPINLQLLSIYHLYGGGRVPTMKSILRCIVSASVSH